MKRIERGGIGDVASCPTFWDPVFLLVPIIGSNGGKVSALRQKIRGLWPAREKWAVTKDFALEAGLDDAVVARVFDDMADQLRSNADNPAAYIETAIGELSRHGLDVAPLDEAALEKLLSAVPEPDATIMREYKSGKLHWQIAEQMGIAPAVVMRSLARTYADLRVRMLGVER
jgi:hypothetical protein